MSKRALVVSGLALLALGVLLFVFRVDFAQAFLQFRGVYFYKIQIFAYAGGISFLIGLLA